MNKVDFSRLNVKVGDIVVFKSLGQIKKLHEDHAIRMPFDNQYDLSKSLMFKYVEQYSYAKIATIYKEAGVIGIQADEHYTYSHLMEHFCFDFDVIAEVIPAEVVELKEGDRVGLKPFSEISKIEDLLPIRLNDEMRDFLQTHTVVTLRQVFKAPNRGVCFSEDRLGFYFDPLVIDFGNLVGKHEDFANKEEEREKEMNIYTAINKVMYNKPATIVFWKDGTKTVSVCHEEDTFDPEKGLAICVLKKLMKPSQLHDVLADFAPKNSENCQISLHDILKERKKKISKNA